MENIYDYNHMRHVGWESTSGGNSRFAQEFFSKQTVNYISRRVTENLHGLEKLPIKVTDDVIAHVMSQVYTNRRPKIGDIHSRLHVPDHTPVNELQQLIERTIEIISNNIRNEYEIIANNEKLTIWTTVYGDFNEHGLRQHAPIKIRHKRSQQMTFNMNY